MERGQLAEPELSFSSWCSSGASASSSEAAQGPLEEVEEASASSSSPTVRIAIRRQPIILLQKHHHKHRKRTEPPPVRSLLERLSAWTDEPQGPWSSTRACPGSVDRQKCMGHHRLLDLRVAMTSLVRVAETRAVCKG